MGKKNKGKMTKMGEKKIFGGVFKDWGGWSVHDDWGSQLVILRA